MTQTQDWSVSTYEYLAELAELVARQVHSRFPMVERDDLSQEALIWAVKHPERLQECLEMEDPMECSQRLSGAMRNAAREYARRQRASANKGDVSDDVWYQIGVLKGTKTTGDGRGLLHHIYDDSSWMYPENNRPEGGNTGRSSKPDPAEGNGWLATLSDVSRAVSLIPPADQGLIEWHYQHGKTYEEIGELCDPPVSAQTVMRRMDRAVKKVQQVLGGPKPRKDPEEPGWDAEIVGTRHAISNASARAITDGSYSE